MTLGKGVYLSETQVPSSVKGQGKDSSLEGLLKGAGQDNVYHSVCRFSNAVSLHRAVAVGSAHSLILYDSETLCWAIKVFK